MKNHMAALFRPELPWGFKNNNYVPQAISYGLRTNTRLLVFILRAARSFSAKRQQTQRFISLRREGVFSPCRCISSGYSRCWRRSWRTWESVEMSWRKAAEEDSVAMTEHHNNGEDYTREPMGKRRIVYFAGCAIHRRARGHAIQSHTHTQDDILP